MRTHRLAVLVGLWWVAAAIILCTLLSLSGCDLGASPRMALAQGGEIFIVLGGIALCIWAMGRWW